MIVKWFLIALAFEIPVILLVFAKSRGDEKEREGAMKEERGRGLYLEILSEVWQKAKGRGLHKKGGYDNCLYFVALDEALRRLRRGDEVEPGVAGLIIDGLGFHLEQDGDGVITVAENETGAGE
jgi:hypothetical protein